MVEEVNIFRLKVLTMEPFFPAFSVLTTSSPHQQQAPTEHLSSACFSKPLYMGLVLEQPSLGTHPNQTHKVYLGSEILLITLFFLLLAFSSLFWGGEEKLFSFCSVFLIIFTKNEVTDHSDFNLYQTQAPAFYYCFASDLCFPSI